MSQYYDSYIEQMNKSYVPENYYYQYKQPKRRNRSLYQSNANPSILHQQGSKRPQYYHDNERYHPNVQEDQYYYNERSLYQPEPSYQQYLSESNHRQDPGRVNKYIKKYKNTFIYFNLYHSILLINYLIASF